MKSSSSLRSCRMALSGFAKSPEEKANAEYIARNTKGVREVRNNIIVRP